MAKAPPRPQPRKPSNVTRAVILMAASTGVMSATHVAARWLSQDLHPFEVAFFRNAAALLVLTPLVMRQGLRAFRSARPGLQAVRGIAGIGAMLTWYMGLSMVPVAEATAISFSVVIFSTVLAIFILREKVGPRRWSAVVIGLVGMLIIIRPGIENVGVGALLILASTVFWAFIVIAVKVLSRYDSSVVIVFYSAFYAFVFSIVPAMMYWTTPTWTQVGVGFLIGLFASVALILNAEALKAADASVVMPVDFTRLIWAAGIGFLVFAEFPDLWTWVGGMVIFASTLYISYRESRMRKAAAEEKNEA